MVRGHVHAVGRDRHWRGEVHLLPPRRGLVGKGPLSQQLPTARPEAANVRASVGAALVEPEAANRASHVGAELHPDFHGSRVGICRRHWDRRGRPNARARTGA